MEPFLAMKEVHRGTRIIIEMNRGRLIVPVSIVEKGSEATLSAMFIRIIAVLPVAAAIARGINGRGDLIKRARPPDRITNAEGIAMMLVTNDITGMD
jgi:hypothetical protein